MKPKLPVEYLCNTNGMQEIVSGVYLGPYSVAQLHCLGSLVEKGIRYFLPCWTILYKISIILFRYIICVRTQQDPHYLQPQISDPAITYLNLDIADKETENILRFFPYVNSFIDEALKKNCKVLVHGSSGNSRSATLVLAYVMQKFGLSVRYLERVWKSDFFFTEYDFSDALRFVRAKRTSVAPNAGFKAQLSEYEPIYKARRKLDIEGSSSSYNHRSKRKLDQLIDAGKCDFALPATFI